MGRIRGQPFPGQVAPNSCGPFMPSKQKQMYIGDDGPLTLEVTAENVGEGAYEAELHVYMPPQADFSEVIRNKEVGALPVPFRLSFKGPCTSHSKLLS